MGKARSVWTALIVSAIVLGATPHAHANPKAAAVHNRQGKAYFDANQYDEAIAEFKKSYDLEHKPITLFKIASAYYAKADYQGAIDYYGQYLQADPEGPYAAQALEFTTIANRALAEVKAKREAAEAATRKDAEAKAAAAETERKRQAGAARVKNADAFMKAGAWVSAGDEYRAATELDGDPSHLLDAAEAYRKKPDHAKASDAYRAYLEQVSSGAKADDARAKLAESTRALEAAAERKRTAVDAAADGRVDTPTPPKVSITRGWSSWGARAGYGISFGDQNPRKMNSSAGNVAGKSFEVGAFVRYQLGARVALRPEAMLAYRSASFDTEMVQSASTIKRGGIIAALPVYFSPLEGATSVRFGAGPFLGLMPYNKHDSSTGGIVNVDDFEVIDPGFVIGVEIDFGFLSIEARYMKVIAIGGLGTVADSFETSLHTIIASFALGFEPWSH